MLKIAVLASGSGTNAENIYNHFKRSEITGVKLILSEKKDAGVFKRFKNTSVKSVFISRQEFKKGDKVLSVLKENKIDIIVLAGFLTLVPENLISSYENMILNIHPGLLPQYGGKGMYGKKVHEKVLENGETQTGISIHYVNPRYDEGKLMLEARCPVYKDDTVDKLAARVHRLEYRYYPQCIEHLIDEIKESQVKFL